jgi:hypothetical protein
MLDNTAVKKYKENNCTSYIFFPKSTQTNKTGKSTTIRICNYPTSDRFTPVEKEECHETLEIFFLSYYCHLYHFTFASPGPNASPRPRG